MMFEILDIWAKWLIEMALFYIAEKRQTKK